MSGPRPQPGAPVSVLWRDDASAGPDLLRVVDIGPDGMVAEPVVTRDHHLPTRADQLRVLVWVPWSSVRSMGFTPPPAPAPYDRIGAAVKRVMRGMLTEAHRYQLAELLTAFEITRQQGYALPEPLDARLSEALLSLTVASVGDPAPPEPLAGGAG